MESTVHKEPLYGHISGTITVSETSISELPDAKKARKERQCLKDFEGYVGYVRYTCTSSLTKCFNFTVLLKMLKKCQY